jgi:hypothetical protein
MSINQRRADPVAGTDRGERIFDHLVMEQYDPWLFGKILQNRPKGGQLRPVDDPDGVCQRKAAAGVGVEQD